jgi:hypothetical protein
MTYGITPFSGDTELIYEDYLKRHAIADVVRMSDTYGPLQAEALRDARRDGADGYYEWGGEGWRRTLNSNKHLKELALMNFCQSHGDLDRETLDAHWRQTAKVDATGKEEAVTRVNPATGRIETCCKGQLIVDAMMELIFRPNSQGPTPQKAEGAQAVAATPG